MVDYSLTTDDIRRITGSSMRIIDYDEIRNFKKIEDLIFPSGCCVILFVTHVKNNKDGSITHIGHWTFLNKCSDTSFEFFDSLGNPKFVREYYACTDYLVRLIYEGGYKLFWNKEKLQKMRKPIATCGRWVCLRYKTRDVPLSKFVSEMKSLKKLGYDLDEVVTQLIPLKKRIKE